MRDEPFVLLGVLRACPPEMGDQSNFLNRDDAQIGYYDTRNDHEEADPFLMSDSGASESKKKPCVVPAAIRK